MYLDHITRLEEVTQDIVTSGDITEGTGDGLVSCEVGRMTSHHKVMEVTGDGPRPHHKVTEVTGDGVVSREVGRKSSHWKVTDSLMEFCVKKPRISKVGTLILDNDVVYV